MRLSSLLIASFSISVRYCTCERTPSALLQQLMNKNAVIPPITPNALLQDLAPPVMSPGDREALKSFNNAGALQRAEDLFDKFDTQAQEMQGAVTTMQNSTETVAEQKEELMKQRQGEIMVEMETVGKDLRKLYDSLFPEKKHMQLILVPKRRSDDEDDIAFNIMQQAKADSAQGSNSYCSKVSNEMEGAVKNATKQVDTASTLSAGLALMGREERERYDKQQLSNLKEKKKHLKDIIKELEKQIKE